VIDVEQPKQGGNEDTKTGEKNGFVGNVLELYLAVLMIRRKIVVKTIHEYSFEREAMTPIETLEAYKAEIFTMRALHVAALATAQADVDREKEIVHDCDTAVTTLNGAITRLQA
jgi:hypothetical protein